MDFVKSIGKHGQDEDAGYISGYTWGEIYRYGLLTVRQYEPLRWI